MSGAHDQARDAAEVLFAAVQHNPPREEDLVSYYKDEIETIAEYLGVKEREQR